MSKRILTLSALACAMISAHVCAHELAFSKAEQARITVPGESGSWCKETIELSIERPTWDNQDPLDRLLSKIPYILKQECPKASVSWKALDGKGVVYATGKGSADNLGLAVLATPTAKPQVETPQAPIVAEAKPAETPVVAAPLADQAPVAAPAPVAAQAPVATPAPVAAPAPTPATPDDPKPLADIAQQPVAAPPEVKPAELATPAAVQPTPSGLAVLSSAPYTPAELAASRQMLRSQLNLVEVKDQNSCIWLVNNHDLQNASNPDDFHVKQDGASCVDGYARGEFSRATLHHKNQPRYNYGVLSAGYVHPSGIQVTRQAGKHLENLVLGKLLSDHSKALFKVGTLEDSSMELYIAFERNRHIGKAWHSYYNGPFIVGVSTKEDFAYTADGVNQTLTEMHQLVKAQYKGKFDEANFFVTNDISKIFEERNSFWGQRSNTHMIIKGRMRFDEREMTPSHLLSVENYAQPRKAEADRIARAELERTVAIHREILDDYKKIEKEIGEYGINEPQYTLIKMHSFGLPPAPIELANPVSMRNAKPMIVNIEEVEDDHYVIDYPVKGRVYSEESLDAGWHVLVVAPTAAATPLKNGILEHTYRAYKTADSGQVCDKEYCATGINLSLLMKHRYGDRMKGYDWKTWTIEGSRTAVKNYEQLTSLTAN